jgi:DNA polymerase-3 subunit delta'
MLFRDIIGQEKIKERLIRSVQEERVSHAQLFSGPEGTGKLGLAVAYAQYLSCRNRSETDSCGTCPSCRKYGRLQHPDLHFVFPIFKKKNVQKPVSDDYIAQWREMLLNSPYFTLNQWMDKIDAENAQGIIYAHESESIIRKLNIKPYESGFKVMIIWLPERMHQVCANKLLKMVEEPPEKTLFLLVTEDEERIIPTIRSRTQIIRIPKITPADMQQVLEQDGRFDPETIAEMVHRANGNYLKALEYADPGEDKSYYFEAFQKIMRLAYQSKVVELIDLAEELGGIGRERQKDFFVYAMQLVREYFMMNFGKPALVFMTRDEKVFGNNFARFINERNVISLNALFEEGYRHITMNGNGRIVFTDSLLKVVRLIRR